MHNGKRYPVLKKEIIPIVIFSYRHTLLVVNPIGVSDKKKGTKFTKPFSEFTLHTIHSLNKEPVRGLIKKICRKPLYKSGDRSLATMCRLTVSMKSVCNLASSSLKLYSFLSKLTPYINYITSVQLNGNRNKMMYDGSYYTF